MISGVFLAAGAVFAVLAALHFARAKRAAPPTAAAWQPMIVYAVLAAVCLAVSAGIAIARLIG